MRDDDRHPGRDRAISLSFLERQRLPGAFTPRRVHVIREAGGDGGGPPFDRIEKHELLHPNVVFPVSARKGREVLRGNVYDLIAAGQPERGVGARDRAELHGGEVDQVIVILPLAAAVIKTFLPDQQPFAVFGPVERADRSFALADRAVVVDRASVDLDLEPADLLARPRHHQSLLFAAGFELSQLRELIATRRPRIRFCLRLRRGADDAFLVRGGIQAPQPHVVGYVGRRRCELDHPAVTGGMVVVPRGVRQLFENAICRIPGPDLLVARAVLFVNAAAEDHLSECGRDEQERQDNGGSLRCGGHFQRASASVGAGEMNWRRWKSGE